MVKLYFQPTLPFPFDIGYTLWVRPVVPFVFNQPIYDSNTDTGRLGSDRGLGDITLDVYYGTTLENCFLWSVGLSGLFPTASNDLGSELWTLGPGFQLGSITNKSVLGIFANHQWEIDVDGKSSSKLPYLRRAGSDEAGISLTAIQFFGTFLPGGGWNIGTMPIITRNHESEEWAVLLHLVAGKTFIIHSRPWKLSLDFNYYVERPDALAPEWMVGFNVATVVENVLARSL